jgi:integrase/recombinase XerD
VDTSSCTSGGCRRFGDSGPQPLSRRLSVLSGFYRTCVIDSILEHSPAEYVRRPHVPSESPTLGLSHLQLEAMLSAGRDSRNINDFALVAMLGLLGLRIFEGHWFRRRRPWRSPRTQRPRHAATRRLRALASSTGISTERMHPHMLRHTCVTTMLDAGVDLRDAQIAARHADPAPR